MKIVKLEIENVKRIKAVQIEPDGALVVIGGKNGAGKSTVLDCIEYIVGGNAKLPSEPIRKGEDHGWIKADLGDFRLEKTITKKGAYLKLTKPGGTPIKSPQKLLNEFVGPLSFDPAAFANMDGAKQRETLKALVGVDFTDLDAERAIAYASRTEANRDVEKLQAQIEAMPEEDAPDEPVSVKELVEKLRAARNHNGQKHILVEKVTEAGSYRASIERTIGDMKDEIEDLEEELREKRGELIRTEKKLPTAEGGVAKTQKARDAFVPIDEEPIEQAIQDAEAVNARVARKQQRTELVGEHKSLAALSRTLSKQIAAIDAKKKATLTEAKFPIEGLSFDANCVVFNGLPFEQASQAEKLRVSVAMGLAMNPKLRVLLIRDGSLLDKNNLRLVAEMAEKADAHVWIERVSEDGQGCSVLIEDGHIGSIQKEAQDGDEGNDGRNA